MAQNASKIEQKPLTMQHGHTDTQVVVIFSKPIENLLMTPTEAEACIANIRDSL